MKIPCYDSDHAGHSETCEVELPEPFVEWLTEFDPSAWAEYSGHIYGMWQAWEAGREFCSQFH